MAKDLTDGEQFISEATGKSPEPTQLQGEYVLASRKDATRRQRITLAGVTIALVVSIALGVLAYFQRQAAIVAEANAVLNSQISFARELTANAINTLDKDPELSILLSLQAVDVLQNAKQPIFSSTQDALRLSIQTSRLRYVVPANMRPDGQGGQIPDDLMSVAFSPDGRFIVTGSITGKIKAWKISHFPYSPYNQTTYAGTVWLEDAFTIPDASDQVLSLAFSPNGKKLAASTSSESLMPAVWDVETGKELYTLSGHKSLVQKIIFSPDGKLIATASTDGEVIIWDANNGTRRLTILDHTAEINSSFFNNTVLALAFSPDGKYLVSGGYDDLLIASDIQTGESVYSFETNFLVASAVAFSPGGNYLTYGNGDGNVITFDFKTQKQTLTNKEHKHHITSVKYSPDGNFLLSAAHDGKIIVLDAHDGTEAFVLSGDKGIHIIDADFSPDGKYIASVNYDGQLKIWDASPVANSEAGNLNQSTLPVWGLDYSPDGSQLAISHQFSEISTIWTLPLSNNQTVKLDTNRWITDFDFSLDGKKVASSFTSFDGGATIWDTTSGKALQTFDVEASSAVAFSPDDKFLGVGVDEKQIAYIYDVNTGEKLNELVINNNPRIDDIDFSPDGKWFAAALSDATIQILNLTDGQTVTTYSDHTDWVTAVKFNPDGKYLLTGSMDGTAVLRDINTQKIVLKLNLQSPVMDVAFSPDGSKIATATGDGIIKMWAIDNGSLLYTMPPSNTSINKIKFNPDGKILAAGGADGIVRFYYVQNEDIVSLAKARITRSLTEEECQTYLHQEKCPETIAQPYKNKKPDDLFPLAPITYAPPKLKSGFGSTQVTLSLTNNSNEKIKLIWVNYEGGEDLYSEIAPGQSIEQASLNTFIWRLRDSNDNSILEYEATTQSTQKITINTDLTIAVE
ncbi:MAG: hypothetical protein U0Z26_07705 [Anaerolineales bacterium]